SRRLLGANEPDIAVEQPAHAGTALGRHNLKSILLRFQDFLSFFAAGRPWAVHADSERNGSPLRSSTYARPRGGPSEMEEGQVVWDRPGNWGPGYAPRWPTSRSSRRLGRKGVQPEKTPLGGVEGEAVAGAG